MIFGATGRVQSCIRPGDAASLSPQALMKSADRFPIKGARFIALGTGRV